MFCIHTNVLHNVILIEQLVTIVALLRRAFCKYNWCACFNKPINCPVPDLCYVHSFALVLFAFGCNRGPKPALPTTPPRPTARASSLFARLHATETRTEFAPLPKRQPWPLFRLAILCSLSCSKPRANICRIKPFRSCKKTQIRGCGMVTV